MTDTDALDAGLLLETAPEDMKTLADWAAQYVTDSSELGLVSAVLAALLRDHDTLLAALRAARVRGEESMRERAAAYHQQQINGLREACDQAWVEYTPDLGLRAIEVHKTSLAAILALPTATAIKETTHG